MEKELVDIVLEKSYIELSVGERTQLAEWCSSEEEYDQMKQVFLEVERMKVKQTETVRPETKKSLDALFMEKHRNSPAVWNNPILAVIYPIDKSFHRRPLVQIAAIVCLLLLAYPLMLKNNNVQQAEHLAHMEKQQEAQKTEKPGLSSEAKSKSVPSSKKEVPDQPVLMAELEAEAGMETDQFGTVPGTVSAAAPAAFVHPDGIYEADKSSTAYSQPVSDEPGVLDLLTVTF